MNRLLIAFFLIAAVGIAAGCKNNTSSGSSGPTPIPTSSNRAGLTYLAYGDDFTVGLGTVFCGVVNAGPCSTSPTQPGVSSSVNPTGWAQRFGSYLTLPRWQPATFAGLGVNGALTGGAPLPEGPGGDINANSGQLASLSTTVQAVRSNNIKTLITIESGINDVLDAFYSAQCLSSGGKLVGGGGATISNPCTASNTQLADVNGNVRNGTLYKTYLSILSNIHNLAGGEPEATILVGVPDLGQFPAFFALSAVQRTQLTNDSKLANAAINAAVADSPLKAVAFADWFAYYAQNPQYYTTFYFASDLFHLNDQGYAVLEPLIQQTFQTAFPSV